MIEWFKVGADTTIIVSTIVSAVVGLGRLLCVRLNKIDDTLHHQNIVLTRLDERSLGQEHRLSLLENRKD